MVENVNHKKLVGDICLHKDLVPERCFLRRNLRVILDSHERQLDSITNAGSYEDMIANEQRISGWDFPTTDMLKDLMKGEKPVLQLDSLQIRHPKSRARIQRRLRNQTNGDDDLSWLPDPHSDFKVPCRVEINVLDARATGTHKKHRIVESVAATVIQTRSTDRFPTFNVQLQEPFLIELDKLMLVEESGTNGYRWKRTVTAKYSLEIRIFCGDADDTAELFSRLEDREVSDYDNFTSSESVLKAVWDNLPECPPAEHLLSLKHPRGHKSIELDHKLEVAMGWTRKQESPLQRYNQKMAEAQKASRQLPTPSASDDMEKLSPQKFRITFKYQHELDTKKTAVEGLFCPFCPNGPRQREHPSLDRYRLHLISFHNHFKFEVEEPEVEGSSVIRRTLWISLADEDPETKVDEGREEVFENWVAPTRPLNIGGYVRGTDKWGRSSKVRSRTKKGKTVRDRDRDYTTFASPQPIRKRPAPDEVEDLPDHRPPKRQVPYVPGVMFYHTTSKQVLEPGESVAESDEYVDESWLTQNQTFGLKELSITGAAQEFTTAFNKHLAREQSDSSILTKEALVRFARIHHEQLQDIEWQRQFRAKLNQFREAGIIGDDIVSYCVRQLNAQSEPKTMDVEIETAVGADVDEERSRGKGAPVNGGMLQRSRKKWTNGSLKGKAPMINGETPDGKQHKDSGNSNGEGSSKGADANSQSMAKLCICGTSANHTRGSIPCSDPGCIRRDYHLACVGLDRRVLGWRCDDCAH